jgi:hypothetical protein
MFDKRRPVLAAAGLGFLLSGVLGVLAIASAMGAYYRDPHRLTRRWEEFVTEPAHFGAAVLGGVLLFGVALAGLVVAQGLTARAARLHPTSSRLAGLCLTVALVALAGVAVWTGAVAPYAALQYQAGGDDVRATLRLEALLADHLIQLGLWCFLGFLAPGLYFLARALRGERSPLPDALKLAAALLLLHLPVGLYLARESLVGGRYVRWLAVADAAVVWSALAAAVYLGARWLRGIGRALPE